MVEIFIRAGQYFQYNRSEFSVRQIEIFNLAGPDFQHDKSRFSVR